MGACIKDLKPLLALEPLPEMWGSHGWERRLADGTEIGPKLSEGYTQALICARAWIEQLGLTERCEDKGTSLAVHWRGAPF